LTKIVLSEELANKVGVSSDADYGVNDWFVVRTLKGVQRATKAKNLLLARHSDLVEKDLQTLERYFVQEISFVVAIWLGPVLALLLAGSLGQVIFNNYGRYWGACAVLASIISTVGLFNWARRLCCWYLETKVLPKIRSARGESLN